jgi:hypothetical protein
LGVARPITGHFFYRKLGGTSTYDLVAAGDSIYVYTSATATVIASGLTDNSETYWDFVQMTNPVSQSNDMVIMTNGVDAMRIWKGTGTAVLFSSLTSASGIPVAKFITTMYDRLIAANKSQCRVCSESKRI